MTAPRSPRSSSSASPLVARLSFECPASLLVRLRARYDEPHRHYHTWSHILACFDARDQITRAALPEVDLALLFHDAIYDPRAGDNEARSAELLVEEGRRAWLEDGLLQRARALIGATKHGYGAQIDREEACIVVDADLSILGADEAVFAAYEEQVRLEYAHVEEPIYRAARAHVLRSFLARPLLYATRRGQHLWEERARRNLAASASTLEA